MNDQLKGRWEKGKNNTLHFYTKKLPWKNKGLNYERYLPDFFDGMIGSRSKIKICELGAGMFCTIGSLWKTAEVEIYASDALADEFNKILKANNVKALIPLEKQDMENLTYQNDFFDIVYCCNALDHCTDPLKAIQEMHRVVKPGGYIYLQHAVNVGEHEKYAGLHMWNIDMDDNKNCILWNQNERLLLERFVPGFKNSIDKISGLKQIVSVLHKE